MNYENLVEGKVYNVLNYGHCVLIDKPNLCFMPLDDRYAFLSPLENINEL